jgi:hypothetical protein
VGVEPDKKDENYEILKENRRRAETLRDQDGKPFEIEAQRGAPRRFPAFLAIRSAHVCLSAGSFWNN